MKKLLFTTLAIIGFVLAGCNNESGNEEAAVGFGSLKVTITSQNSGQTRATNEPTQQTENTVHSFAVYVFHNGSGLLEKSEIFSGESLVGTVTDLNTSSAKKVVVLVNFDFTLLDGVNKFEDLDFGTLNIDSQVPGDFSTYGLFMSGIVPDPVQLTPSETTSVTVEVKRAVSKVRLESLTLEPQGSGFSPNDFALNSISMQRVPLYAFMLGDDLPALEEDEYSGGLPGPVSQTVFGFLKESFELPAGYVYGESIEPGVYFYVFPNDNSDDKATLLTIHGTYKGKDLYYTFPVNGKVADPGVGTTDGNWIEKNKIYTLNITLKNIGLGADSPDTVADLGTLEGTINVNDWDDEIIEIIIW